jgi:outer membrane biogenesis lipoprotein LolB
MITPPPTIKNEPLWQKHRRQVRALAWRIIEGQVGVIEGSRQMLKFQFWLHAGDDEDFRVFRGVDSETDHLPVGRVREHWNAEALKKKDEEIAEVEDFYRQDVIAAATRIRAKYE